MPNIRTEPLDTAPQPGRRYAVDDINEPAPKASEHTPTAADHKHEHAVATAAPPASPPRRRSARAESETIPVGTEVWYRLRRTAQLIPAVVIDKWTDDDGITALKHPRAGCAHLEIELDPEVHHSGSDRGLRQNVPEGDGEGMWRREWPEGEEQRYAERQYRKKIIEEEHIRQAQGRSA